MNANNSYSLLVVFVSDLESPIKLEELNKPCSTFKINQINDISYWREVKKFLIKNLGFRNLDCFVGHSINRTLERNKGQDSTWPSPRYDAMCLVVGRFRRGFNADDFLAYYPSCRMMINKIRKEISFDLKEI